MTLLKLFYFTNFFSWKILHNFILILKLQYISHLFEAQRTITSKEELFNSSRRSRRMDFTLMDVSSVFDVSLFPSRESASSKNSIAGFFNCFNSSKSCDTNDN